MNPVELAIFAAHARASDQLKSDPALAQRTARTAARGLYANPLRSWSLVLRANDKRIDRLCASEIIDYHEWDENSPQCAIEEITLDAQTVRALCAPVMIPFPGVSIDEAARLLGVNRTTIFRWGRSHQSKTQDNAQLTTRPLAPSLSGSGNSWLRTEGRLVIDYYCKRNGRDLHRADKYVWTRAPVDPAGEVWTVPWDDARPDLTLNIPDGFIQKLQRTHRPMASRVYTRFLECPQCAQWCFKLFWPRPIWTVGDQIGTNAQTQKGGNTEMGGFQCRRCAKLIYESAERTSTPASGRRANIWDRYVKRATDCLVRGCDVNIDEGV